MDRDVLQFYKGSADKYPGRGVGEHVNSRGDYLELSQITNWRRMFSDMWNEHVQVDGYTYGSHHHAFQAAKFWTAGEDEIAFNFTIESNSKLGLGTSLDAYRARKTKMLSGAQMEKWEKNKGAAKDKIYQRKYCPGSAALRALMATGSALLVSKPPRGKRIECTRLMGIRDKAK